MLWSLVLNLLPIFFAIILAFCVIWVANRNRKTPGAVPLMVFMVGVLVRSSGALIVTLSSEANLIYLGVMLSILATLISPTAWFLLSIQYARGQTGFVYVYYRLLLLEPFIVGFLLLVDPFVWQAITITGLENDNNIVRPLVELGPLLLIHSFYSISLIILASLYLITRLSFRMAEAHTWQTALILSAIILPILSNLLLLNGIVKADITPIAHSLSGLAFLICILRFHFLDMQPGSMISVMNELDDGIILLDKADKVNDVNRAVLDILQKKEAELLGQDIEKLLPVSFDMLRQQQAARFSLNHRSGHAGLGQHEHCYEALRHFELRYSSLEDHQSSGIQLLILKDITTEEGARQKQVAYTEALEASRLESERFDELKSAFFANMTHEFRTPLTLILGGIENLFTQSNHDTSDLEMIQRNASRLKSLVSQLMDLSKLDAGAWQLKTQELELVAFVTMVLKQFSDATNSEKIEWDSNQSPVYLQVDPYLFETVLVNLISNALRFTEANGYIRLHLILESNLQLVIEDDGCGMTQGELAAVFDRFYQANLGLDRSHEGTGIGLALVKEIIDLHEFTIAVKSEAGKGSCFTIDIPVDSWSYVGQNPLAEMSPELVPQAIKHNKKQVIDPNSLAADEIQILVVDDNADMRGLVKGHLKSSYSVIEAEDGLAGLALAQSLVPDLIISDVMMPKLDGYSLCTKLGQDIKTSHIPVLLLTAKAEEQDRIIGLQAGAIDYLVKPFNAQELMLKIRNTLNMRQKLRVFEAGPSVFLDVEHLQIPSAELSFLERVKTAIDLHISDPDLSVTSLAAALNLGERQFRRKLSALTGESPNTMIRRMRLALAARYLQESELGITEIAYAVGFGNPSYFSERFRDHYGSSPSEYQIANC